MGIYLNPDNRYFSEVASSGEYVDKTGLIAFLNNRIGKPRPYIASSRPRRFGKSMAVSMISSYYSRGCDSRALFKSLEISKAASFEKHLNQYDVIKIDIQDMRSVFLQLKEKNGKTLLDYIQSEVLNELREAYPDCVGSSCSVVAQALSNINKTMGIQFVVIIDEWDCFFREEKDNEQLIDDYIIFLRSLFKGDAPDRFIRLAYITGILPIKKYGTQSALNNFREMTMTEPGRIGEYIGFTEAEVRHLCDKDDVSFRDMEKWYDGYFLKKTGHIYCPNSVMEAIENDDFQSYWSKTETYESLKLYIEMNFDGLKDKVIRMLAGERCLIDVSTFKNDMTTMDSSDDVLTLLVHLGYLAYDSERREAFIPNLEVRESFESAIKNGKFSETAKAISESDELIRATISMNEKLVAEQIEKVHRDNINALAYNSEQSLTTVILLAYYRARDEYTMFRELPSGEGFADIVFVPKRNSAKPALIVELKWDRKAETALAQIRDKKYPESLSEYHGNMLLVGINYDKEEKKHACRIEKFEK